MSKTNFQELLEGIMQGRLVSASLSSPSIKNERSILKISLRPVTIKSTQFYQLSEQGKQQVFHRNLLPEACVKFIEEALENYRQGIFNLIDSSFHVLMNNQNKMTVIKKEMASQACAIAHNRPKKHILQEGMPVPFLVALGIMSKEGTVIAKKYDKFRQINRFLEMVRDIVNELPSDRCLEIVDFGCGKAYLTFALHHYLHIIEKREVRIQGLDLKKEVIAHCQQVSEQLKLEGLTFTVGDINQAEIKGDLDLMISLHACDTATDAALEKAVHCNTTVILCVPCCQHELFKQVKQDALAPILSHGILKERFAALATDAARVQLLETLGYQTQILEFIDVEHTPKNLLIRAIRRPQLDRQRKAWQTYLAYKEALHIDPSLERRFREDLKSL